MPRRVFPLDFALWKRTVQSLTPIVNPLMLCDDNAADKPFIKILARADATLSLTKVISQKYLQFFMTEPAARSKESTVA